MKIIANTKKIERNRKIGNYTMLAGMVVLFGGLFISISQIASGAQNPGNPPTNSEAMFNYATIAMFAGLILTEVSMYFNNRWGRKPSIEEKLSLGLKGLDDRYVLYHHRSPVDSLLVGPAGIWVLVSMYQKGTISFEKGRYHQMGVSWFTRTFYQEGIGRPELLAQNYIERVQEFVKKNIPESKLTDVNAAIVFTAPNVNVQIEEEPVYPAMHVDKLKDFIRRKAKEQPVATTAIQPIIEALPEE
jgi:hypothetical protein